MSEKAHRPGDNAENPTELFEQWRDFLHVAPETDVPEIVYHYTNAAGLFGILSKKSIFVSDRHFLNDKTEVSHGRERATDTIQLSFKKRGSEDLRGLLDATCELINLDDGGRHFIFSMSEREDDLSQWRGYANEGDGYTIGFDAKAIRSATAGAGDFGFNRVSYSKSQFDRLVTNISTQFIEKFRHYEDIPDLASCFSGAIEGAACYHKHTSFRYEREWRIVLFSYPEYTDVEVRESNGRLVPFIQVPLQVEEFQIPIKSIGIGPAVRNPNAITAIRDLCRVSKVDAEIYNAATPFVRY